MKVRKLLIAAITSRKGQEALDNVPRSLVSRLEIELKSEETEESFFELCLLFRDILLRNHMSPDEISEFMDEIEKENA